MTTLSSSAIAAAGYDRATARLFIRFTSGYTYTYYRVPESVFQRLIASASPGSYYKNHIRDRYS